MQPAKKIVTVFILSLILSGCSIPFIAPQKAALQVASNPRSAIFIDGKHVGQTPFLDDKLKPGEYTVKLVPEDPSGRLPAWETKIELNPQILTVVSRDIAATDQQSSGEILTLEPLSTKTKSAVAIVSLPDTVVIKIDNQPFGFTPKNIDDIAPGEHTVSLTQTGYKEKTLRIKIDPGNKLTISVQLAKESLLENKPSPSPSSTPTPSSAPEDEEIASASATTKLKPYVEILPNSIGFLRIRKEPSTTGIEIARAFPGQRLPYVDEEKNGWYKVTYISGKTGWLARGASGEYAKLVK